MDDRSSTGKKKGTIDRSNRGIRGEEIGTPTFGFFFFFSVAPIGCPGRTTSGPIEADFNSCREFHVRLALNNRDANAIRAESGPLNEYG